MFLFSLVFVISSPGCVLEKPIFWFFGVMSNSVGVGFFTFLVISWMEFMTTEAWLLSVEKQDREDTWSLSMEWLQLEFVLNQKAVNTHTPTYRQGNSGSERLSYLPEDTQQLLAELDRVFSFLAWSHVRMTQCTRVWDDRVGVGSHPLKTWKEYLLGKYNISAFHTVKKNWYGHNTKMW